MPDGEKVEIKPAKGRPLLTWVGKRPLRQVTAFPAPHIETFATNSGGAGIPGGAARREPVARTRRLVGRPSLGHDLEEKGPGSPYIRGRLAPYTHPGKGEGVLYFG